MSLTNTDKYTAHTNTHIHIHSEKQHISTTYFPPLICKLKENDNDWFHIESNEDCWHGIMRLVRWKAFSGWNEVDWHLLAWATQSVQPEKWHVMTASSNWGMFTICWSTNSNFSLRRRCGSSKHVYAAFVPDPCWVSSSSDRISCCLSVVWRFPSRCLWAFWKE